MGPYVCICVSLCSQTSRELDDVEEDDALHDVDTCGKKSAASCHYLRARGPNEWGRKWNDPTLVKKGGVDTLIKVPKPVITPKSLSSAATWVERHSSVTRPFVLKACLGPRTTKKPKEWNRQLQRPLSAAKPKACPTLAPTLLRSSGRAGRESAETEEPECQHGSLDSLFGGLRLKVEDTENYEGTLVCAGLAALRKRVLNASACVQD